MIGERPKREEWKTLVLVLPLACVMFGAWVWYEIQHPCEDPCEQISTTPVATVPLVEEGDDVATISVGNTAEGTTVPPYRGVLGNIIRIGSGMTPGLFYALATPEPWTYAWPANLSGFTPVLAFDNALQCAYVVLDDATYQIDKIVVWIPSGVSWKHSVAITDASFNVIAKAPISTFPPDIEPAGGWVEFAMTEVVLLSENTDYWLVTYESSTSSSEFRVTYGDGNGGNGGNGGDGTSNVLPLLKTNSGSEAGLLR